MVLEHALLQVKPGQYSAFESAMAKAKPLISASSGFLGLEVRPLAEGEGRYLLLVSWENISDHRDGFRCSDRYQEWKSLLHGFYDPMPQVDYFGESIV